MPPADGNGKKIKEFHDVFIVPNAVYSSPNHQHEAKNLRNYALDVNIEGLKHYWLR